MGGGKRGFSQAELAHFSPQILRGWQTETCVGCHRTPTCGLKQCYAGTATMKTNYAAVQLKHDLEFESMTDKQLDKRMIKRPSVACQRANQTHPTWMCAG